MALFDNQGLVGGVSMFFAQYLVQAGIFFAVPLFLSVVLELNALRTGLRSLPLSVALLLAAGASIGQAASLHPARQRCPFLV